VATPGLDLEWLTATLDGPRGCARPPPDLGWLASHHPPLRGWMPPAATPFFPFPFLFFLIV